jgi:hypothetical protein
MTQEQQHPKPPPKLVGDWLTEAADLHLLIPSNLDYLATSAAQWGADQELEACVKLASEMLQDGNSLRAARRPKPPSLKEQALARTDAILNGPNRALLVEVRETLELNRRALEALNE